MDLAERCCQSGLFRVRAWSKQGLNPILITISKIEHCNSSARSIQDFITLDSNVMNWMRSPEKITKILTKYRESVNIFPKL